VAMYRSIARVGFHQLARTFVWNQNGFPGDAPSTDPIFEFRPV
jgi:hypothetical protein